MDNPIPSELNTSSITDLLNQRTSAIHVKNYFSPTVCEEVVQRINAHDFNFYEYRKNYVGHIGLSSYDIECSDAKFKHYYDNVEKTRTLYQEMFDPHVPFIDTFVTDLSQHYKAGVQREQFHEREMSAGMIRNIQAGSCVMIHQDNASWNLTCEKAKNLVRQFAVNIYLKAPSSGGELLLWHVQMSHQDFHSKSNGEYCFPIDTFRSPDSTLQPKQGDLIIFDANQCHAVNYVGDSDRIAVSAFLGFYGHHQPLTYWS